MPNDVKSGLAASQIAYRNKSSNHYRMGIIQHCPKHVLRIHINEWYVTRIARVLILHASHITLYHMMVEPSFEPSQQLGWLCRRLLSLNVFGYNKIQNYIGIRILDKKYVSDVRSTYRNRIRIIISIKLIMQHIAVGRRSFKSKSKAHLRRWRTMCGDTFWLTKWKTRLYCHCIDHCLVDSNAKGQ